MLSGLFGAGVLIAAVAPAEIAPYSAVVGASTTLGAAAAISLSLLRRVRPSALFLGIGALALGLWRASIGIDDPVQPWSELPREELRIVATIDAPVDTRGATAILYARIEDVTEPPRVKAPPGRIRATLAALPPFDAGERVEIVGRFEPVDGGTTQGRRLLSQGVVATTAFPQMAPLGAGSVHPLPLAALRVRASLRHAIQQALPEPHASLLAGLLVGSQQGMPEELRQALVASGTTHLVVVSGYNITLVAGALAGLFHRSPHLRRTLPVVGVWLFTLLAGGTAPSVRAAIMATVAIVAVQSGRGRDALGALALATAAMLLIDPRLVHDLGFQLSMLATLGLVTLQPRLASLAPWLPSVVREPVAATLAAQLATTPLLATTFHQVSISAPLANALAAPAIPVATVGGALGVGIVVAAPAVAPLVGAALAIATGYLVNVIELAARFPGALVPTGNVAPLIVVPYASALLAWAALPTPEGRSLIEHLSPRRLAWPATSVAAAIGAILSVAACNAVVAAQPGELVLSVLDVGDGDAVFLRSPRRHTILVDGGPNPAATLGALGQQLGIAERTLSAAILTRADQDRLPGAVAAAERYRPHILLEPPEGSSSALYRRWQAAAPDSPRSLVVDAPLTIDLEPDLSIELLPTAPLPPARSTGIPQRTVIVRVVYRQVSVLVAPSLTPEGLRAAMREGWPLTADAVVVPRLGGRDALDESIIVAVKPSVAVISVGSRNREGRPAAETLRLLEGVPTYRTDLHGTVEIRTDGARLWVALERNGS